MKITQSTTASFQKGAARIDGTFSATQDHIDFEPFNKQVALGPYHLDRKEINKVEQTMGKGGGIIPTTTEAIRIVMNDDSSYEFILSDAQKWVTALNPEA
ncbi:hypothetical protein [Marinicella rhabdoformis]|uniref:hypothetical protein n=1 Tax=Marinicella rhabdoformis TaxID=2580566 RepID=UPI0012AEC1E5|nr:hypothetical protein [Marinicella rhabdoformis]